MKQKLKGDLSRYIAEYEKGIIRDKAVSQGLKAYQDAMNLTKNMPIMDRNILGLILNFSIFNYEVFGERKNAIAIGDECIKKVEKEMTSFDMDKSDENYDVIMDIINKIKHNVKVWKIEEDEQNKL